MDRLADRFVAYRRCVALAVTAITIVAVVGLTRVDFEDEPRTIFEQQDSDFAQLEQFFADFGADDNDLLLVVDGDDFFTSENASRLRQLAARLVDTEGIETVASIFDIRRPGSMLAPLVPHPGAAADRFEQARQLARKHPLVVGQFLSADGRTMLIVVRLAGGSIEVSRLATLVSRVRAAADESLEGTALRVRLAGHPVLRVDSLAGLRRELLRSMLISAVVSLAIALITFRRLAAVIIAFAAPAIGMLWTLGAMGLMGEKVNGVNSILPAMIYVIGFADTVHVLLDFRRARIAGLARKTAAAEAIRNVGLACLLAAATTAVGFGSLALARTYGVQRFGMACAWGAGFAFLAVMTVVPLLACTRLGDHVVPRRRTTRMLHEPGWITAVLKWVFAYPRLVTAVGAAASLALLVGAFRLHTDIQFSEAIPDDSETAEALRCCDEAFGGALQPLVVVQWPEDKGLGSPEVLGVVDEVHRLVERQRHVSAASSVRDVLVAISASGGSPEAGVGQLRRVPTVHLHRIVRPDLRRLVVRSRVPNIGAAALAPSFAEIERGLAELEQRHPGFSMHLTGTVVVAARNLKGMIEDIRTSLSTAVVVIFLVMTLGFRSLRLGLISIVPNLFPLAFVGGLLAGFGEPLRITSAMTFNICLGVAVNDTIHMLIRYIRERRVGDGVDAALRRTTAAVGTVMAVNTAVLAGGFAALLFCQLPAIRSFGGLSSLAMLAALVGDLIILPAMVLCFAGARQAEPAAELAVPARKPGSRIEALFGMPADYSNKPQRRIEELFGVPTEE
jgi:hydrophobe/amphiphile efflux-3 (HAE3) family protein